MVYGGLLVGIFNPLAGAAAAAVLYQMYKAQKAVEDAEREIRRTDEKAEFKAKFYRRQAYGSYEEYLMSDEWSRIRATVVIRANGCCEYTGCKNALEEVHHKYYPRVWGTESTDSLIGLCEKHHRQAHNSLSDTPVKAG